ncbi:uncharacterized protein LOC135163606 [Diachasmimorpha longicaudata]|uniref:uncharacterized protein LOC135163606 n=1 Tax=Diachasmimorpha longicaudata TaxID=58733 RepID=UPI0030B8882E
MEMHAKTKMIQLRILYPEFPTMKNPTVIAFNKNDNCPRSRLIEAPESVRRKLLTEKKRAICCRLSVQRCFNGKRKLLHQSEAPMMMERKFTMLQNILLEFNEYISTQRKRSMSSYSPNKNRSQFEVQRCLLALDFRKR